MTAPELREYVDRTEAMVLRLQEATALSAASALSMTVSIAEMKTTVAVARETAERAASIANASAATLGGIIQAIESIAERVTRLEKVVA